MPTRPFAAAVYSLACTAAFAQIPTMPASTSWRQGPRTDQTDVATSAGANGTMSFSGSTAFARLYVTCSGAIPAMGNMVMLKIAYRQPPYMPQLQPNTQDTEQVEGVSGTQPQQTALQAVRSNLGTGVVLALQTLPGTVSAIAAAGSGSQDVLSETFSTSAGNIVFRFPIPPADATLKSVLTACGFQFQAVAPSAPASTSAPAAAPAPAEKPTGAHKLTVAGFYVGMTVAEAEKAGAATGGKRETTEDQGQLQGLDWVTPQIRYQVELRNGRARIVSFTSYTSMVPMQGLHSGPLYQLMVQNLGNKPTSDNKTDTVLWGDPDGENATYTFSRDEGSGAELRIGK